MDPETRRNRQKRDFVAYFRVAGLARVSRKNLLLFKQKGGFATTCYFTSSYIKFLNSEENATLWGKGRNPSVWYQNTGRPGKSPPFLPQDWIYLQHPPGRQGGPSFSACNLEKKPSPSTQRRKARGEHSLLKLKAFLLQYDENSRS